MKPSPYLFLVFSSLASQKCVWPSTTKYRWPSFSYMRASLRRVTGPLAGDEDRPGAGQPALVEVVEGVVGRLQGVRPGVEGDLALGGQGHQLGQVVVGPDDVADDVALAGDDLDGRDLDLAAVA